MAVEAHRGRVRPNQEQTQRRKCQDSASGATESARSSQGAPIRVVARIRPKLPHELPEPDGIEAAADGRSLVLSDGRGNQKPFAVDGVFDSRTEQGSQAAVFEKFGKDFVLHSLKGYNVCIFAYGHTGSGKTFTMIGDGSTSSTCVHGEGAGLLPRFLHKIFLAHAEDKQQPDLRYTCEFYEVYNENIRDLLAAPKADRTRKVHVHPKHGVRIESLTPSIVHDIEDTLGLLSFGNQMRTVAATTMNARSSRSHAIFTFKFENEHELGSLSHRSVDHRESTVTFVDLAGREDQSASKNRANTFREMCFINTSLFHLTHLINKLSEGHIEQGSLADFRNSKLTLLLSQALIGNSRTALVATLVPLHGFFDESTSTMSFAQAVKGIQTRPAVNNKTHKTVVTELEAEVRHLQEALSESKTNAAEREHDLLAAQALISHYRKSWEEAIAQSEQGQKFRRNLSRAIGMYDSSNTHSPPKTPTGILEPFFTKLVDDPSLQGCCNYFLNKKSLRIGSNEKACSIVLQGVGIRPQMCEVRRTTEGKIEVEILHSDDPENDMPRVLVDGQRLQPGQASYTMEHGSSIIIGYAHGFRLVVPTQEHMLRLGTADTRILARSVLQKLDMSSAVLEISDERGEQFQDIYQQVFPYLQQLSTMTEEDKLQAFLRALHCLCPLIDEANLITQDIFGSAGVRFQLHSLTNIFKLAREGPELVVCVLQGGQPRTYPGQCSGQLLQESRNPLVSSMGLDHHMTIGGRDPLLYVWSLEKFLYRLNEIREIYQDGSEARDSFAAVRMRLAKQPMLDPWHETTFAETKLLSEAMMHYPGNSSVPWLTLRDLNPNASRGSSRAMSPKSKTPSEANSGDTATPKMPMKWSSLPVTRAALGAGTEARLEQEHDSTRMSVAMLIADHHHLAPPSLAKAAEEGWDSPRLSQDSAHERSRRRSETGQPAFWEQPRAAARGHFEPDAQRTPSPMQKCPERLQHEVTALRQEVCARRLEADHLVAERDRLAILLEGLVNRLDPCSSNSHVGKVYSWQAPMMSPPVPGPAQETSRKFAWSAPSHSPSVQMRVVSPMNSSAVSSTTPTRQRSNSPLLQSPQHGIASPESCRAGVQMLPQSARHAPPAVPAPTPQVMQRAPLFPCISGLPPADAKGTSMTKHSGSCSNPPLQCAASVPIPCTSSPRTFPRAKSPGSPNRTLFESSAAVLESEKPPSTAAPGGHCWVPIRP